MKSLRTYEQIRHNVQEARMDMHAIHRKSFNVKSDQQISKTMYYLLEDLFLEFKGELESELEFHE